MNRRGGVLYRPVMHGISTTGTRVHRRFRLSRRAIIVVASFATLIGLIMGGLLAYPSLGRWAIRSKVVPRLEQKLGRKVTVGDIEVHYGWAILRDVDVRGDHDGAQPLVHVERVDVDFDFWPSIVGSV